MKNYMYEMMIKERGYTDVPLKEWRDVHCDKFRFVEQHLSPALKASRCGWENVEYRLMETADGGITEFIVLWAAEKGKSGSRWINVSGDSRGSIMCAMCDNLW
jgi:hypothetical protein